MVLREQIAQNGFAVIPVVLLPRNVSRTLSTLASSEMRRSRAGIRHILSHSAVTELALDSRLLGLAKEVLGSSAIPFRATLFDKSQTANWLVVWHQDTALPLRKRVDTPGWGPWSIKDEVHYAYAPACALEQVLALRVHLDDSTAQSGPLRVLPGTHTLGVLADDVIHRLSLEVPPIDCLVPAAGVLAMRPLIVHASSKSHSRLPRRVLHIEYARSTSIASPLEIATT
jgi:ectoine hydroxylase-related dioxygenase (phytanoyl-CoA dioxygenase family)